ncbi:two-component system response regulator PilR (NtrC family) [Methylohalomonas lacus]|uniref:Two-component system response regulator PilR (NtrC family) n=1 Tax=Methylohalomonas lacus TaxID=398773 RepID=A0AAE3L230_9GAMM|nr:sigma-54 dependent transcriptional regulator [Methylohalomonas lacus]MCS3903881.1 two-component system response regulator PilR (NtrC family) [Methylohalomonas lacus]
MAIARALIVDDEPDIRELLAMTLARMDIDCDSATNLEDARELLNRSTFHVCLTDMRLPDGNGIDFVGHIQKERPQLPVAVITAHGNMESAIQALKAGAFDFVTKPVDLAVLRNLVETALKLSLEQHEARHELIGDSPAIREVRSMVAKLARSEAPVYISGESGTGKELVARLIHEQGARAEQPFVPVNCGAIPPELMESEFFGYKKGSFTGATSDKDGLFQAARGGTLFLDEIAELPQSMQVKLLRAIQEKSIRPIGANEELAVDVRILSATHQPLAGLVANGQFRQDLFYRINVIELYVPPLRERSDDIALLADHILARLAAGSGRQFKLSSAARQTLSNYSFPGNVRELENILERATALCDSDVIDAADLRLQQIPAGTGQADADRVEDNGSFTDYGDQSLDTYLVDIEKQTIMDALEKTRWNKTAAAKLLGISFRALRYRLEKLGLE